MSQQTTGAAEDSGTGPALPRERLREKVLACLAEAAEARGLRADLNLCDESILLESGLDSLGFAVLVVRLEETLGYDPFVLMTEPVYPKTLGEFLDIYMRHLPVSAPVEH
ncbi:MAG TPA: phosphopantetheine-binding protein [Bryobacteraceae bacterium]|nr:phosphopantetheine-binding protein [Bryobacteraceae bacterium]